MAQSYKSAEGYKLDGNAAFREGNYEKALTAYTQAITKSGGRILTYFTNRALCRLRLAESEEQLEKVIEDCEHVLDAKTELDATVMKAKWYTGQAQLRLGRPNEAYTSLVAAYRIGIREKNPTAIEMYEKVLEARKMRWERQEHKRLEQDAGLRQKLVKLVEHDRAWRLQVAGEEDVEQREAITAEADQTLVQLQEMLARSDTRYAVREVPEWLICPISLGPFVDPVLTPSGRSYERTAIMQHLKVNPFDPLTRQPLIAAKIFDNLALRDACEAFLKDNGWAVDY
ncbi:hypothetical protein BCR37DRAFT_392903 [Protomyces lactucae-debilis]|uniref:RING-type E3 ubiquitin transferase n=1 Tax=Protomyces lactucae-debilis TaxID=2754530 RepID=A0A1Y2FFK8_PROLT|nr:uncharacterized protein BCR37DRAFT_392903 [Protomyces lactucae-debilis]ORY82701.1 hypothetical protein BCR37DRAFT_392903 [Protomyces lactucae-debilis]